MAGNKHKNGIVCMFPGCEKKMRTQKFKGHFIKAHLREGEEYTVDHRRQFEVAQTEPLADSDSASATASPMELMGSGADTPKSKIEPVKRESLDMASKVADAMSTTEFATEPPRLAEPEATPSVPAGAAPATTVPFLAPVVPAVPAMPAPSRAKRPAASISMDTPAAMALPTVGAFDEATMVKMFVLMDRRINDLTTKMDEMVEMQRLLISAIMSKDASTEEHAAKKRKETSSTVV